MEAYTPPVDQLLRIGDNFYEAKSLSDYPAMGIGPDQIADLLRMAVDQELNEADSESPEVWAPLHAWRALGQLRAESAIPTLVGLLASQDDSNFDEWVTEEIPEVLGMIGPAAIPPLLELLESESASLYARMGAVEALGEIGSRHPQARDESVAALSRTLERVDRYDDDAAINGWIVAELIELEANESAKAIEQAYAAGRVDESICGYWFNVWHKFDLEGEPPPAPANWDRVNPEIFDLDDFDPVVPDREGWQPVAQRTPDERKERNKARQKLEKQAKARKRR